MTTRTFEFEGGVIEVDLEEESLVSGSGSETGPESEAWGKWQHVDKGEDKSEGKSGDKDTVKGGNVTGDKGKDKGNGDKGKGDKGKGDKGKGDKGKGDKGKDKGGKGDAGKEHQPHDHWRRMETHSETVCTTMEAGQNRGTSNEKADIKSGKQYGNYTYTCAKCVAERDGLTIQEAHRQIKQPRTAKSTARSQAFEHALKKVQETFTFLYVDTASTSASVASASASVASAEPAMATDSSTVIEVRPKNRNIS